MGTTYSFYIPLLHHLFLGVNNYMRKPSKKSCKQVYLNFKVIKNIHLRAKKCLRIKFLRTLVSQNSLQIAKISLKKNL